MSTLRVSYYAALIFATSLVVSAIANAPSVEVTSQTAVLVADSD
jgi:hypothetical protein